MIVEFGLVGHVGELASLGGIVVIDRIIAEQCEPTPTGHEQIGIAVVVVIGHSDTVRVEIDLVEADFLGDILELEVAQVLVQLARPAHDGPRIGAGIGAAAGKEDIEQAVAVVVDQTGTAAERFEDGQVTQRFALIIEDRLAVLVEQVLAIEGAGRDILTIIELLRDAGFLGHVLEPRVAYLFFGWRRWTIVLARQEQQQRRDGQHGHGCPPKSRSAGFGGHGWPSSGRTTGTMRDNE